MSFHLDVKIIWNILFLSVDILSLYKWGIKRKKIPKNQRIVQLTQKYQWFVLKKHFKWQFLEILVSTFQFNIFWMTCVIFHRVSMASISFELQSRRNVPKNINHYKPPFHKIHWFVLDTSTLKKFIWIVQNYLWCGFHNWSGKWSLTWFPTRSTDSHNYCAFIILVMKKVFFWSVC